MDKNTSTIFYKLADGQMVNIEVSIYVKEALELSERQEQTQQRQKRRYGVKLISNDTMEAILAGSKGDISDLLVEANEHRRLNEAISLLSEKQRRRFLLHFLHGLTYQQIAEIEKVKANSVYKSVEKALLYLRNTIRE